MLEMPNCFFIYFPVDRNKCNFFLFFLPLPPTPEEIYRENKSLGKARNKRMGKHKRNEQVGLGKVLPLVLCYPNSLNLVL